MIPRLPDFMIIGPTRCGTGSLYVNLFEHPRIDGTRKDIDYFFYMDDNYKKGIEWYKAQFPNVNSDVLLCDATAMYIFSSQSLLRIYHWVPKIKLIVMLRNPIARSYSNFCCNYNKKNLNWQNFIQNNHSLLAQGVYVDLLLRWFDYFDRKQFLIIKSEDFFEDSGKVLSKCFKFLNLPDMEFGSYKYWDPRKRHKYQNLHEHPKIPHEIEEWLGQFFASHNQRLYHLLGKDFEWENRVNG